MSNVETSYHYPNTMGRILLLAMEEIMGRNGVNATLNIARLPNLINNYPPNTLDQQLPFPEISQINASLEALYGVRGGRGVALRTGRACFKYGLREFGPVVGCTELAFRLQPLSAKLRSGAELFAKVFNQFSDQQVRVEEDAENLYWKIERCPVCWKRHAESPTCHLAVGVLQEALYWVSGGKYFNVEETECIATGDPTCTISIGKLPLE